MKRRQICVGLMLVAGFAVAAVGDQAVEAQGKVVGKLKFEIYKDKKSEFRWRLLEADGGSVATSGQGYTTKQSCKDGVESVKKNGTSEKAKFEVYEDNAKAFRWKLLATNGNNIASSSGSFKAKADCEAAITALKKGLSDAVVEELKE